jgi:hypothetical protein
MTLFVEDDRNMPLDSASAYPHAVIDVAALAVPVILPFSF